MTDERKYDDPDIQKFAEENREMIEKLLAEEKARQAKIEAEARARAEAEYIAKRNAQQRYEDAMAREDRARYAADRMEYAARDAGERAYDTYRYARDRTADAMEEGRD